MAGDRELPPLRIKITGDASGYKKTVQQVKDLTEQLGKSVKGTAKAAAKANKDAEKEFLRQFHNHRLLEKSKELAAKREEKIRRYLARLQRNSLKEQERARLQADRDAQRQAEKNQKYLTRLQRNSLKMEQKTLDDAAKQQERNRKYLARLQRNSLKMEERDRVRAENAARRQAEKNQRYLDKLKRNSLRLEEKGARDAQRRAEKNQKYLNKLRQNSLRAEQREQAAAKRQAEKHQRYLVRLQRNSLKMAERDAARAERERLRAERASQRGRSRGSRYESFGGLGDRADIYMHTNAIRTILDMAGGFIRASADWQMMSVQLEVLTGSAEKAAEVMERMRVLALESPYDMQTIMDGTKRMIAYGASIDQATTSVQQLLDVAGGDNVKLDKLTLAMAQIFSKKVLKGDELRQLTEHGFNPLQTIAEKTGMEIAELTKMQQEGMITAEMVAKALDIETAAGGRFANMSFKMSWTLKGMVQQVEELVKLIQKRFMDTLIKDAERYMRILVDMLKRTDEWLGKAENQAWVRYMAETAAKVMIAAVAFNVLGLAVAGIRWQLRIMFTLVSIVTGAIQVMTAVVAGLRTALVATKVVMMALTASNPVGWILLAGAAVVALIAVFMGSGGLKGAFTSIYETGKWVFEGIQGFFYNFKHNMSVIGPWLLNNWGKLWMAMANITIRSIGVITGWLIEVLPGQIIWAIESAAVAIAQTITSVMQTMKEIVSFAWQNLSDPEAILRFIGSKFIKGYTDGATSGLMGGLQKAWTEELAHIQGPALKLDVPGLKDPGVPNAPALDAPKDVDFKSMLGAGGADKVAAAGGSSRGPIQAVREGSAEQALLIYEQTQGITAAKANDPQLKVNQEQLGVLAMIEKNTRRTNGGQSINISPANLAGVGVA